MRFYGRVLDFQSRVAEEVGLQADTSVPLLEQMDYVLAAAHIPGLLEVADLHGSAALANAAKDLRTRGESGWIEILRSPSGDLEQFFSKACLQPMAENLQVQYPASTDEAAMLCPVCGSLPQLIILRPEGEGARRSLLCSLCLREWLFRRVLCPDCSETDKEKLPYYTAAECRHVRVEACDTCRRYLKSVDLSVDGLAVPLVDEVALSALDVWAADRGYQKIAKNLVGL